MKHSAPCLVTLSAALLGLAVPAAHAQTLIWSDEFDGTTIDPANWTFDVGGSGFGNQELQFYSTRHENVRVENGNLIIEAHREAYEGKQFTSARLKSHGRLALKYGTIEAKVWVPDLADGLWPAFWLLGDNIGQIGWPACGEIDILEMGSADAIDLGLTNNRVGAAAHWDYFGNYAQYGTFSNFAVPRNLDYHIYSLSWTPTALIAKVDSTPIWTFDISGGTPESLEEFHAPHFIVLNLAVGGINFVDITDPAQITAPLPATMHVDWIRIYDNPSTELTLAEDTAEAGTYGIFTDTTPVTDGLVFGSDAELYIWSNMTAVATAPQEGANAWGFDIAAGTWFGMGTYLPHNKNMQHYRNGNLHLHMKTTSTHTIGLGIASAAAGEGWIDLVNGGEQYGLQRDGAWHEVVVPLNKFANVDFNTISQMFMLKGEAPAATFNLAIDNVYWTPSEALETPENGSFGVYTETAGHKTSGEFVLGVDGEFYVWENTLLPLASNPYEGGGSIALGSAPGFAWFGAAFTPNEPYNLTAFRYPESKLRFAMKTSSNARFKIGMKGGVVDALGQEWITFEAGSDPYGFVRDGQWHVVEIPMADLGGVDLTQVTQLFELLGTDGAISDIEIDDVCFINGGAAIHDNGGGAPIAHAGPDQVITLPTNSVVLPGSGEDDDGTITGYAWAQVSGPSIATLSGAGTATLTASNLVQGIYIFRLTVTDNDGLTASDTVQVTVATPEPTANAGADQSISLPTNSVTLHGSGWDSDGTITAYAWAQISGPSTATLAGQNTATLMASNLVEGVYVFELTVTDNDMLTGSDQVTVEVINPPQNIALGKPATASSEENAGTAATLAVDGNAVTRWSSIHEDPQWIEVDLEGVYNISQVVLVWETASAKTYDIEVSVNGADWTSIYSTSTGPGATEELDVSGTGRYIRMYGTERNTPWGYSLFEFEVYGVPAGSPADLDGNGVVNLDDYALLAGCLAGPGVGMPLGCDAADVNEDGLVDLLDFAEWQVMFAGQ